MLLDGLIDKDWELDSVGLPELVTEAVADSDAPEVAVMLLDTALVME